MWCTYDARNNDICCVILVADYLGVYGDVIRVKIMFNKKDNALIQFNDPTQAQMGTFSA
jgi:hypothetical protein